MTANKDGGIAYDVRDQLLAGRDPGDGIPEPGSSRRAEETPGGADVERRDGSSFGR
jgi:hypothetical protein